MKIILSRKGFDSENGGQASPILPDGTLLSMPIPSRNDHTRFTELFHEDKNYYEILRELKENTSIKEKYTCHLDPDIRSTVLNRPPGWKPAFGQSDAALGHLTKSHIEKDDIFLFFGWFRQTEIINGKLNYVSNAPDLHVIYGYLQIGEIHLLPDTLPEYVKYHPHAGADFKNKRHNCIYIANSKLSFNSDLPGSSPLLFNENLVLTKTGMTRSKWDLPKIFRDVNISYHSKDSFKTDHFHSAAKGQEFVIDATNDLINWASELIVDNAGMKTAM